MEALDPRGPANGWFRVLRGGSFHIHALDLRASDRNNNHPDNDNDDNGFRVVWVLAVQGSLGQLHAQDASPRVPHQEDLILPERLL